VHWSQLPQGGDQTETRVNTLMKLRVP